MTQTKPLTDAERCYRLASIMHTNADAIAAAIDFGYATDAADFDEKVQEGERLA